MPYTAAPGTETQVIFETSGLVVYITNLDWLGIDREALDATHLMTPQPPSGTFGNREYIPSGMVGRGEIVLDVHFNPELDYLIDKPPEWIRVIWPTMPGFPVPPVWRVMGFVRFIDVNDPMDGRISATMTIQLTAGPEGGPVPPEPVIMGGWIPAMSVASSAYGGVYNALLVATQVRPDDALPTTPAVYRSSPTPSGAPWLPEFPLTGGGQATAMVLMAGPIEMELAVAAAMRFTDRPDASELWRLGATPTDEETLLFALPDNMVVTSLLNLWPMILIGTDAGAVYRLHWNGTLELVMYDPEGRSVRLAKHTEVMAFIESPTFGLRVWTSDPVYEGVEGSWSNIGNGGLYGTRCSHVDHFGDNLVLATSSELGEGIYVYQWIAGQGAQQMQILSTERNWQRPLALWVYPSPSLPHIYVGIMSTIAEPMLDLWDYHAFRDEWSIVANFANFDGTPDLNTSITAIAPVMARGAFFVATGSPFEPYDMSAPAPRIYHLPLPEGCHLI